MYIKLKILNIPTNSSMIGYFKKNFKIFTYPDISLKNNIAIITEKIADIKTAPAAISFAIFATILYSFLQMSTTLSIALLIISDTITRAPVSNKIAYFSALKLKNTEKNIT